MLRLDRANGYHCMYVKLYRYIGELPVSEKDTLQVPFPEPEGEPPPPIPPRAPL